MKLSKIFAAALVLCLAIGCETSEFGSLSEIQLSQTYASIDVNGGSSTLTINANEAWEVDPSSVPSWLTVAPMSGSAGQSQLTLTAAKTKATNTADILIKCGIHTQHISVIQFAEKVDVPISTAAEVIAGADKVTYRMKGTVTDYNPGNSNALLYGNWYLKDDTGTVYIYGTLDPSGNTKGNPLKAWGIENGDIVTIEGPKTTYNGTVELVDVAVIAIEKSLIKVDSTPEEDISIEGGNFDIVLTCKGDGVSVVIPDDAKSWLSINGIRTSGTTATVTFNAAPNAGGDRSTTLSFVTTSDGKSYSAVTAISQKGAIIECSIADFNAAAVGDTQYRVTGIVTKIAKVDYGNFYIRDWSGETYVYGYGAKGDFAKTGVKVGDIITIVGKRGSYGETIEMLNSVIEKTISVNEVDFPAFIAAEKSKDVYYRLTGVVSSIANASYGRLYIKDEAGNEIYVYGVVPGWGATGDSKKEFLATAGIEVGDKLTVEGYKDVYNGTIELCGGYYISHEKGGSQPDEPQGELVDGSSVFTVDVLPTTYGDESVVKCGNMSLYVNQVANFGNGVQFKKAESYIANKTACKKIKKITLVSKTGKQWYPGNLHVYAGSSEKPETEISAVGEDCLVYDFSGKDCSYFKIANTSGYAVYLESITIEY